MLLCLLFIIFIQTVYFKMDSNNSNNFSYQTTPIRNEGNKLPAARRKAFDRALHHPYKSSIEFNSTAIAPGNNLEKMPLYTPPKPSQLIKNPFEQAWLLKEKLSQPICSPSLFQKAISPIQNSPIFSWNVDDISILRPAQIDENPSQEFTSWYSPDTENQAQAAIDRFFSSMSQGTLESPLVSKDVSRVSTISCQTNLSFPPFLPDSVEAELIALSQRLTLNLDESMNALNSSNCSARRKILTEETEIEPSDEFDSDISIPDKDESMRPIFTGTPMRPLQFSSPECSPIPTDSMRDVNFRESSISIMEGSCLLPQSPSR